MTAAGACGIARESRFEIAIGGTASAQMSVGACIEDCGSVIVRGGFRGHTFHLRPDSRLAPEPARAPSFSPRKDQEPRPVSPAKSSGLHGPPHATPGRLAHRSIRLALHSLRHPTSCAPTLPMTPLR